VIYLPIVCVADTFCDSQKNTLAFTVRTVAAMAFTKALVMVFVAGPRCALAINLVISAGCGRALPRISLPRALIPHLCGIGVREATTHALGRTGHHSDLIPVLLSRAFNRRVVLIGRANRSAGSTAFLFAAKHDPHLFAFAHVIAVVM